jgi:ATP-dependent DNA helicase RecQ
VAIVYARSRRSCEEIARTLRGHGIRAEHYHAGLDARERTRVQEDFVAGRTPVVVATTAFGMGIDKANVRLVALVNFPDSLESYVQMVGRAGRDGDASDTVLFAGDADATALRRFALGGVPTPELLRTVYRALRDAGGTIRPDALEEVVDGAHDPRVLVGMLEQAGIVRRDFDAGRAMRVELLPVDAGAGAELDALLDRYGREAAARVDRIVEFADQERCRHLQVAEHFGETLDGPCGACDVCAPRAASGPGKAPAAVTLPDDPARAIVEAVRGLAWPLGRRSLVAMLRGSVKAPPSARRSPAYGSLAAASDAEVTRWVRALEVAGALVEVESDGFRVLRVGSASALPSLAPAAANGAAAPLVAELKAWRTRRAREDGVPAYVVLHDATLTELAARRPGSAAELAAVKGLGPTKIDRYGDELLDVLATV